ncbi:MAG TPA: alpha/beta hydrolase [Candidatus Saccharimonadaceae bacterium]|nr:alpha/beta hydrolase [Candidatus Saccharimonadaceae bacterium]
MKQALILHGTEASPDANWFRSLERVLSDNDFTVWLPQLPDSATPNTKTYNSFLLNNTDFTFNDETILVGHSSGAVEILSLLQNLPDGVKVGDVYLVSAFMDTLGWDALDGLFAEPYNYELITEKARSITLIHSDNDPYVPLGQAQFLKEKLNARLVVIGGQGHFNLEQSEDYREFPLLMQVIETTNILASQQKLATFRGQRITFSETQTVADGVECDVYSFAYDASKDLGVIRIKAGSSTPRQQIIKGDRTVEGFLAGKVNLDVMSNSDEKTHEHDDDNYGSDISLGVGDTMQWSAFEDSVCFEICYPPYEEGRFRNI